MCKGIKRFTQKKFIKTIFMKKVLKIVAYIKKGSYLCRSQIRKGQRGQPT